VNLYGSKWEQVQDSCACGDEPSCSKKLKDILEYTVKFWRLINERLSRIKIMCIAFTERRKSPTSTTFVVVKVKVIPELTLRSP
jgi:hypothetical protein